jgi:4a-hydroxytetrahydrobiopterin dehydratase
MNHSCNLIGKKCVPCEGGVQPLTPAQYQSMWQEVPTWSVQQEKELIKEYKFKDFNNAISFINKIAVLAEAEGHHPDLFLHDWNKLTITLSTHAIHGLSENDFIMAAKIDHLSA